MVKGASCAQNRRMRPKSKASRRVLVIDVGGSHVKFRIGARGRIQKFASGPKLTPAAMVKQVRKRPAGQEYAAVSIGYPGLVLRGKIAAEPHHLGRGWVGFDFKHAFGRPVRVINDAAMQAAGSYSGGRMLFLGLGTGLGASLIINGAIEPMEIGHLAYQRGRIYEEYVGDRGRKRLGLKKWRKAVHEVVDRLKKVFEVDYVVLGGGNAKHLKVLPKDARLGNNRNAFRGGLLIWQRRFV